jgi:hypothetical protein
MWRIRIIFILKYEMKLIDGDLVELGYPTPTLQFFMLFSGLIIHSYLLHYQKSATISDKK